MKKDKPFLVRPAFLYAAFVQSGSEYECSSEIGYFTSEADALQASRAANSSAPHLARTARKAVLIVDGTDQAYLLKHRHPMTINIDLVHDADRRRQEALAKLTPEERELLGIA